MVVFGSTSTPLYVWLNFSRRVLLSELSRIPAVQVSFPTEDEIQLYTAAISARYLILTNIWDAVDGIKMLLQESGIWIVQNMFFNGWKHGHYISSIYAFASDGRICICSIKSTGSWHDSQQSEYGVYPKLKDILIDIGQE